MSRVRLGGRAEAIAHHRKASEFLEAARDALASGWSNAATSNAVSAGINAKDALCFILAGRSHAAEDHRAAIVELRRLGERGRDAAVQLDRLLALKDRAQYDRRDISDTDAKSAVRRAERLVTLAADAIP
jgi:hypothetical protein